MAKEEKKSLGDILKKAIGTDQTKAAKTTKPLPGVKATTTRKPTAKAGTVSGGIAGRAEVKTESFEQKRDALREADLKKQKEILHTKTHQDLINAVYKVAEELKVEGGPWAMLRAAGWGNFSDDRGKKYDGPAIDEIEGLDPAQRFALKKILGIK